MGDQRRINNEFAVNLLKLFIGSFLSMQSVFLVYIIAIIKRYCCPVYQGPICEWMSFAP